METITIKHNLTYKERANKIKALFKDLGLTKIQQIECSYRVVDELLSEIPNTNPTSLELRKRLYLLDVKDKMLII
ncbi:hypothetical protein Phi19:1_gp036 [Cellulophaga phage phi19:1]|uniref:Uncharacterized protein n=1 Tax=Cellulophaga phage phi19:1 TaxID=1327970 RepID=R9ZW57_9CAUD|nr:hypothetical protein Phi19:1_gp036 [Cellulophaga phage phi19:1]AGO47326.1 hypothetical protein Phi19:1_gp036 [Cellulophaga phage phi19:1]